MCQLSGNLVSLNLLEPSELVQELLYLYLYQTVVGPVCIFIHSHMDYAQ